ncbi:MAG: energy coupling factor transporter S component ThiW [Oliverpabstia sp.]|nr:energy coupling factor transporter S component ThiW [Lachnospiraceae bacterium]MDY5025757.1 energy coupling factor transporter S component ThiW [Oliverpabstia sp.]
MKKNVNVRKLALAGILIAVGIVCSPLSIPVGASKCAPVQHFVNILSGVFLGPGYAVCMAFVTSLLRNLMGTGTLLAFPGSMCGALLCGLLYRYGKHLPLAYLGELIGTSVIGGLLSYPVAAFLMGNECAVFAFVVPFFISSLGGTLLAVVLVTAMKKMKVFDIYLGNLNDQKI